MGTIPHLKMGVVSTPQTLCKNHLENGLSLVNVCYQIFLVYFDNLEFLIRISKTLIHIETPHNWRASV